MNLTISINGKTYRILKINAYGVGFLIDSNLPIGIGEEIKPINIYDNLPVQAAGIPRHISQLSSPNKSPAFKSGWIYGSALTTRHDRDGRRLLREFLAERIGHDPEETEK